MLLQKYHFVFERKKKESRSSFYTCVVRANNLPLPPKLIRQVQQFPGSRHCSRSRSTKGQYHRIYMGANIKNALREQPMERSGIKLKQSSNISSSHPALFSARYLDSVQRCKLIIALRVDFLSGNRCCQCEYI